MDLKEIGCESVYWFDVAQVRGYWQANVNTVIDLRVTQTAEELLTSEGGLRSMDFVCQ